MNIQEENELYSVTDAALRRAAMLNVDASGLKGKSLPALTKLFEAVDKLNIDREKALKEAAKYDINPSTLGRYGISRATINSNPVLRAIVARLEEQQKNKEVTISKTKYEAMLYQMEALRKQNEKVISLGLQIQRLQKEVEQELSKRIQAEDAYYMLHKKYEPDQPDQLLVDISLAPNAKS